MPLRSKAAVATGDRGRLPPRETRGTDRNRFCAGLDNWRTGVGRGLGWALDMDVHLTALADKRRPVLRYEEFESSPVRLRATLEKFDRLLDGCNTWLHRRVLLAFGTLVSEWQRAHRAQPLCVTLELLPRAVRLQIGHPQQTMSGADWDRLVSPAIEDLVEAWGVDMRAAGGAWFEFGEIRVETHLRRPPLRPGLGAPEPS